MHYFILKHFLTIFLILNFFKGRFIDGKRDGLIPSVLAELFNNALNLKVIFYQQIKLI
jgi:hypothetical protein